MAIKKYETPTVPKELRILVPAFLERKKGEVQFLEECLEKGDAKNIDRVAHNMKGTGASYGFPRLTELAMDIKSALDENDEGKIRTCIYELKDYLSFLERTFPH